MTQENIKISGHNAVHEMVGHHAERDPRLIPLFYQLWLAARTGGELGPVEPANPSPAAVMADKIDVLFLPLFSRANYESSLTLLYDAVSAQAPDIRMGFVETAGCAVSDPIRASAAAVVRYADVAGNGPSEVGACDALEDIGRAAEAQPLTAHAADQGTLEARFTETARHIEGWRNYLRENGTQLIVSPIEHVPAAAVLIAAAKLERIPVSLVLHGTPVRFYAPFFADEMWVWSERTKQAFISYGMPAERLKILGNLEVACQRLSPIPAVQDLPVPRTKVLLFCMQDISKPHYLADLKTVHDAFGRLPDEWSLRIRITNGYDWPEVTDLLNDWFGGFDGRVVFTCYRNFVDDLHDADLVCAGSTSASFTALGLGYPVAVLWNHEVEAMRGPAMVDPARVCRTADDLLSLIIDSSRVPALSEDELANVGSEAECGAQLILNRLGR